MKVFIVMCNDYPDGVFSTKTKAQRYINHQKKLWNATHQYLDLTYYPCPNLRTYEYNLDSPEYSLGKPKGRAFSYAI